jgi:hypothetical protein
MPTPTSIIRVLNPVGGGRGRGAGQEKSDNNTQEDKNATKIQRLAAGAVFRKQNLPTIGLVMLELQGFWRRRLFSAL